MASHSMVLTVVTVPGCPDCDLTRLLVEEIAHANRAASIDVAWVDAYEDEEAVVRSRTLTHPTVILAVDGEERARVAGATSKRRLLHKFLPTIYRDDQRALAELRRQLGSSTETFPTGPLRGRVRQAEKVELIRRVGLFGGLSRRQVTQVARLADELRCVTGAVIIEQGESGDEFFIVAEGSVDVRKNGRKVAALAPGEWFGEMSLLDGGPRSATVTTAEDCVLVVLHRDDFERLLEAAPEIMRVLLTTLSKRLR
ncbi:MAG: cyclic nucleotide-binding domain-containing protein [Acidimicrobiia bacterium]|nr:cyclic nucleotide-binding domain-containing protein [Acidimicrobiia bacterium]